VIFVTAWVLGKPVLAASPLDIPGARPPYTSLPWVTLDLDGLHYGQAGTTLRPSRGWNASLFVTSFERRSSVEDDAVRQSGASFVSGRITRNLTKKMRVSLDLINVFDKRSGGPDHFSGTRLWSYPGAADNFLFYPGETRGFRVRLRSVF
jgi:hypothetical protein